MSDYETARARFNRFSDSQKKGVAVRVAFDTRPPEVAFMRAVRNEAARLPFTF